jgi:RimJ/RimL family protein N-acetyltransferase
MKIIKATKEDIPTMRKIFNHGRKIQLAAGVNQWAEGYPAKELILEDIKREAAYLCFSEAEEVVGVASVFTEPDPTYFEIEGQWLNDEPYATIHRIATNGEMKGVGQFMIQWVQENHENVRIDTHKDNAAMKHVLQKLGFVYTGVIYIENGEARDAYHYVKTQK